MVDVLDLALRLEILMDESVQFTVQVPSFIPETNVVHIDKFYINYWWA